MSQTNTPHDDAPRGRHKRRNGGNRAALSAHGEPMVWLTGGCLAISVLMIVGLLWLVLYQGLGTFVPQPIVRIQTVEGKTYMGEPARSESYILYEDMVNTKSDALQAKARPLLVDTTPTGQASGPAERTLYRTGNYRLTNTRFTWISDFEVAATDEPEWAMVVERTEWGRFYGIPLAFETHHARPVSEDEKRLADLAHLLFLGRMLAPEGQMRTIAASLEQVEDELNGVRRKAIDAFIAQYQAKDNVTYRAVLEKRGADALKEEPLYAELDQIPANKNVLAVIEVISGEQATYDRYRQVHAEVMDRVAERKSLKRHDLGEISEREVKARHALRDVELKYGKLLLASENEDQPEDDQAEGPWFNPKEIESRQVTLVDRAETISVQTNVLEAIDAENAQREAVIQQAIKRYGQGDARVNAAMVSAEVISARADKKVKITEENIAKVRKRMAREFTRHERKIGSVTEELNAAIDTYIAAKDKAEGETLEVNERINELNHESERYAIRFHVEGGVKDKKGKPIKEAEVNVAEIVRAYPANRLTGGEKAGVYLSRWGEFLTADPREANQEGGVKQQIIGTVLMTIIMAIAVVPFGVMAALYLREYAHAGPIVSIIRISINNLAGVPSIVFGMFGAALFCGVIGGYIDHGPSMVVPSHKWFIMLVMFGLLIIAGGLAALMNRGVTKTSTSGTSVVMNGLLCLVMAALVVGLNLMFGLNAAIVLGTVAAYAAFYFVFGTTRDVRSGFERFVYTAGLSTCVIAAGVLLLLIAVTPFFDGFFTASYADNNPTFGKGALVWASMTLALLTLPVVIVATEEALSAVPNSMREGSYACGAGKWQTIKRIVLPRAMPGIMTGMILAMARGAGEVAPLMLVGAVKIAPELPFDTAPPFGVNRSFLHLGFHIYDLGFQSPDAEAAKPMVFTTTLLLIFIVAVLNIASIWLRTRLRRKFVASAF